MNATISFTKKSTGHPLNNSIFWYIRKTPACVSILEAIQEANIATKNKGLSFASLQEFNSFKDSFTHLEWPRNVVVPFTLNGTFLDNRSNDVIQIQGWMLTRLKEDTNDFRSVKIEPDFIAPMRSMARKFLIHLINSELTNPEVGPVNYSIRPEYQFLDAHLFGVSYTMNWPVYGKLCV